MSGIRVITVSGEYGGGRADIGRETARQLGWHLVDDALVEAIAQAAHVDCETARHYDEGIDSWFHRLRKALASTAGAAFDADAMAALARRVIEEAANQGQCVIVGRGAQCVLGGRPDVFRVFVYGPLHSRIERVRREFGPEVDAEALVESGDRRREAYVRRHFGQDWTNPHLYDLMLCSTLGEAAAVAAILRAVS